MCKISVHKKSHSIIPGIILIKIFLLIGTISFAQKIDYNLNIQPAKWQNNKSAAVTFTFDDGYYCHFTKAMTLLAEKHFLGTFFIITGNIDKNVDRVTWDMVRNAAIQGHEIGSHTVNHADLTKLVNDKHIDERLFDEVVNSQIAINKQIPTQKCLSFAYPWNKSNKVIENIISEHYMCACTSGEYENHITNYYGINRVTIDSKMWLTDMNKWVDNVIAEKGWLVESIHGIDSDGWHPVSYDTYDQHFTYIKGKESQLWVATVQDIVKYIRERQSFMVFDEVISNKSISFKTTDFLPDDLYNYPITIIMNLPSVFETVISAKQNNRPLHFNIINSGKKQQLLIDGIIPDAGKVTISVKRISSLM